MALVVGLVGRARSGKDTVAKALGPEYTLKRMARPVKDACKALYAWTDEALESVLKDFKNEFWGLTPRATMVHLTHQIKEYMGQDFFTRRFFAEWDGKTSSFRTSGTPKTLTRFTGAGASLSKSSDRGRSSTNLKMELMVYGRHGRSRTTGRLMNSRRK